MLALLKKYNIKKFVVSPGSRNVPISGSVQSDPFFEVYSVIDERSAAYFATGLAHESGEPVVLSCTGATASRNYLSALTEAYYRNLPIIAVTSSHYTGDYTNFTPHLINRSVSQPDVKRLSVALPPIINDTDKKNCVLMVNKALTMATKTGGGPVHIELMGDSLRFDAPELPDVTKIDYIQACDLLDESRLAQLKDELSGKRVGVFVGSHRKFSKEEAQALDAFVTAYDTAVFCDHTSNYHGKNKIMISIASSLRYIFLKKGAKPDIVIDIGGVCGEYSAPMMLQGPVYWRVSEDGEFHQRYRKLQKQFDCPEQFFFSMLAGGGEAENSYYNKLLKLIGKVKTPELPLSHAFISQQLSELLPKDCSLHLAILSSLRNMNFFELDDSIDCSCNVGGFGIDGAVSTLFGQAMVNKDRLYFGKVGDLAFFYDMNVLGNRHKRNNIRLMQ